MIRENICKKWELKPLSEVCTLNPRKSEVKDLDDDEKITFLSMESVGEDGEIYSSKIKTLGEVFKGYTYFKKNDVLFAKITPCMENGKGAIADIDTEIGFGSTEFHVLRPKSEVLPEWIYLFLASKSIRKLAEMKMTGSAGQKRVPKSFFDKTKIPVPPLETQQKIVEILEKAEKLKEWRAEADVLTDEYLKSVFLEMFGDPVGNPKNWDITSLGDVLELITYGLTVRPKYISEGIPLISAREIRGGFVNFKDSPNISIENFNKLSDKCKPKQGDILFSKTGAIGHCAEVKVNDEFAITQNAARLTFKRDKIVNEFIVYYLRSSYLQLIAKNSSKGNAVKDLQLKDMKKFPLYLPLIDLQNQFAETVKKVEQLKQHQKQSKQEIDNLFNTLMQKAFKGELTC
jgi:type I restriction enzyme S subunit